jgi:biotin synthase
VKIDTENNKSELLSRANIIKLLSAFDDDRLTLLKSGAEQKLNSIGNKVYFRGLVEFSNICSKDCYYCGIRKNNKEVIRYTISDDEILSACRFAWENGFGSVVLQSGEVSTTDFVDRVDQLLKEIKKLSNNELGITLSCGEQTKETYQKWFESGAHRYLLRIEASNRELYYKIHPYDKKHNFEQRLEALSILKETGYQVGSGVMIGLPFQTIEDLADDLLFFKKIDIDMCGMGPYIEHENTPLYQYRNLLKSKQERFELALNMIAVLRLIMPDINIAASTALEAIDEKGKEKALAAGANIIMPNLTPNRYRENYFLYENKPIGNGDLLHEIQKLNSKIESAGCEIVYNNWGDSIHFSNRQK